MQGFGSRSSLIYIIAVALALSGAWTAPASAAELEFDYTTEIKTTFGYACQGAVNGWTQPSNSGIRFGSGCFQDEGDKIVARDHFEDGERVAVHWRLGDRSRRGLCVNKEGVPGVFEDDQWCNKDLPEAKRVQLRIGRCDGDNSSCNVPGDYHNWSEWGPLVPVSGGA